MIRFYRISLGFGLCLAAYIYGTCHAQAEAGSPPWEDAIPAAADDAPETSNSSGVLAELSSAGIGAAMIATSRFLLAPKPSIDLTSFETPLAGEHLERLQNFVRDRMEKYPTTGISNPFKRFYNYLNGPVVLVNVDGRVLGNQGALHNYGLMSSSPEVFGELKAQERTLFGRKLPFLGKVEPIGVAPTFKDYLLDARDRGGAPTVVACLDRISECKALTQSYTETTKGRLLARRLANRGGYLAIFLPIILNAEELYMVFFVDEASEVECMTNHTNCGFSWFRNLKRSLEITE